MILSNLRTNDKNHLNYLNYEGPISENRGVVRRVLSGIWLDGLDDSASPTPTDRPDSRRLENGFPLKIVLDEFGNVPLSKLIFQCLSV